MNDKLPNKEWFDEWGKLVKELDDGMPVFKGRDLGDSQEKQLEDVKEYADTFLRYRDDAFNKLNKTSIIKWLFENGLSRTYARLHGRHRPTWSAEEAHERSYQFIVDWLMEDYTRHYIRSYRLERSWIDEFIKVYGKYLYRDHEAVYQAQKAYSAHLQKLDELLQKMKPQIEDVGYSLNFIYSFMRRLELCSPKEVPRDSARKAELQFINKMARINRKWFGSPKPDKISDLMMLPGFKHQFDARHIARLCSTKGGAKEA